jgi:hypothetical protein
MSGSGEPDSTVAVLVVRGLADGSGVSVAVPSGVAEELADGDAIGVPVFWAVGVEVADGVGRTLVEVAVDEIIGNGVLVTIWTVG